LSRFRFDLKKGFAMIRLFIGAMLIAASTAAPALACMEPPEATHHREIALLDESIRTFKREPALIAKAKALRDRADAAFKAQQLNKAWEDRHSALIMIGYKIGSPAADQPGVRAIGAAAPAKSPPTASTEPSGCSGGATYWVGPDE
jgi:hypothetical protein